MVTSKDHIRASRVLALTARAKRAPHRRLLPSLLTGEPMRGQWRSRRQEPPGSQLGAVARRVPRGSENTLCAQ